MHSSFQSRNCLNKNNANDVDVTFPRSKLFHRQATIKLFLLRKWLPVSVIGLPILNAPGLFEASVKRMAFCKLFSKIHGQCKTMPWMQNMSNGMQSADLTWTAGQTQQLEPGRYWRHWQWYVTSANNNNRPTTLRYATYVVDVTPVISSNALCRRHRLTSNQATWAASASVAAIRLRTGARHAALPPSLPLLTSSPANVVMSR